MQYSARQSRREQLFLLAITKGVLSERDRALTYSIGELYQDMSLFIESSEKQQAAMEKARKGLKT
jgi:hypothetical protein